jgi:uncharacterized protein YjbJ (UPF0337 family)
VTAHPCGTASFATRAGDRRRLINQENGIAMSIGQKMRHKAETAKGATKKFVGRLTGNRRMTAEGRTSQTKGNLQQAMDRVKDAFKR